MSLEIDIIVALCEETDRCTVCYRPMASTTANCSGCGEYYGECNCKPLTRKQIEERDYKIE